MATNKGKSRAASLKTVTTLAPAEVKPRPLPMFKVLLHNDNKNSMDHVAESIVMLTPLKIQEAVERTLEAHYTGLSLLLRTHKERAELYVEQFRSRHLTVSIEADE